MIILLIAYHINTLVAMKLFLLLLCEAYILGYVDSGTISSLHYFFIKSFCSKIYPYTAVFFLEKYFLFQAIINKLFAEQVGIAFIINFIEIAANPFVGFIKTFIYPAI